MRYAERLRPPWWWYVLAGFCAVLIGVQIGAATSAAAAYVSAVVVGAAAGVGLELWALDVSVDTRELRVGRARLPLTAAGGARALDGEDYRSRLGRAADPAAFLAVRPWAREGVYVEVADPADPVPYWLVAARRPERLARAINGG